MANREDMITWLRENTTLEQWSNRDTQFFNNNPFVLGWRTVPYRDRQGVYVICRSGPRENDIHCGDVFEAQPPVTLPPTPIYADRTKPRNKYDREILPNVYVDVYDVLNAFSTDSAAIDHAVKKLLAPGQRGVKDRITDLSEAIASIQREIDRINEWNKK